MSDDHKYIKEHNYYNKEDGCTYTYKKAAKNDEVFITGIKGYDVTAPSLNLKIPSKIEESTVIGIEDGAFTCLPVNQVYMPNTIKCLGERAFKNCKQLEEIHLSTSIKTIAEDTFAFCKNLRHIALPSKTESIGTGAFASCDNLEMPDLPDAIRCIGMDAFAAIKGAENISIPSKTETIYRSAFRNIACVKSIIVNCNIRNKAYQYYAATEIFEYCKQLEELAFADKEVDLPADNIYGCPALRTIKIGETEAVFDCFSTITRNNVTYKVPSRMGKIRYKNRCTIYSIEIFNGIKQGEIVWLKRYVAECEGKTVTADTMKQAIFNANKAAREAKRCS